MYLSRNAKARRGFTLTEAAIVLGIMGLILGAIWVAAAAVYKNLRVKTVSDQLLQIAQNVRSMHASQNTVDTSATLATWVRSGIFPKDLVNGTSTIDVWGGQVQVEAASVNGTNGDGFVISFGAVPQDACIDFIARNSGQGRDSGMVGVTGVAGDGSTAGASKSDTTFPINATNALALCPGTGTGVLGNVVAFTFRLKG